MRGESVASRGRKEYLMERKERTDGEGSGLSELSLSRRTLAHWRKCNSERLYFTSLFCRQRGLENGEAASCRRTRDSRSGCATVQPVAQPQTDRVARSRYV
ncbi:hypothetical protein EVAR_53672_1 [Eumeta japonica]|uniref:Uncharacterized protein n=1 Tax=Eumeta variegata TaxID=151549 RepID=A0A4C1YRH1_EUMVA|nr:hypothetical protein EVAR_53672_1 [Eumeta japonica]